MISTLARFLGEPASAVQKDPSLNLGATTRSIDKDLPEPIIYYVFRKDGFEIVCDSNDAIHGIFLYAKKYGGFNESLLDFPFSSNRAQVRQRFGTPEQSGEKRNHPILGDYGPWDRFLLPEYAVHFQYRTIADCIEKITLMRLDVVP